MASSYNTKHIAEGAILTGLFLGLAILTYYTPLFLLSFIILPSPYIIILVRTNIKIFVMAAAAGLIALFTLVDPVFAIATGLIALVIGGGLGYAFKYKWSASKALVLTTITILTLILIMFSLLQFLLGINLLDELIIAFEDAFRAQIETFERIGAPEGQIQDFRNLGAQLRDNLVVFIPSSLIAFSIALGYLQVFLNSSIIEKLGYKVWKLPRFREWRFPPFFTWFYILSAVVLVLVPDFRGYWGMLAANLFVVSNYLLLIQGLAFGFWFLRERKNLSSIVIVILLVVGLILPILNMLIVLVGIIDQIMNLREKLKN